MPLATPDAVVASAPASPQSESSSDVCRTVRAWEWLLLVASVVLLYAPVLRDLVDQWWRDPDCSHGFFVPIFAGYVVYQRRARLAQIVPSRSVWGLVVLAAGLALLVVGRLGAELFLSRTSLLLVIFGLALYLGGTAYARALASPTLILLLAIPIPALIYNQIVFPLQLVASRLAATTLETLRLMPVLREGNVLTLPSAQIEVADACSGIRSLMSLVALACFYGYFAEPRRWIRVLLCVAVVPLAVFSNALRVIFSAIAAEYFGVTAVEGAWHTASGLLVFLAATVGLVAVHSVFRAPRPSATTDRPA